MAAKKKVAKKAAKKTAKKSPAKKAAKKPAKKAVKKVAKKAAKKPAKKATKKVAKKAAKKVAKKVTKKAPAKKAAKKAPAKKVVKREAAKAPVVKKVAKKAAKKVAPKKLTVFAKKQRQRLLDLQDELVDAMSGVTGEIRNSSDGSDASGSGMHQGDAGSDAYDRDFALSVLAKEQDALYEIEQAIRRIDRGVYGICELSGDKIPQARLEAIPFARLTVECQASWEKEYGKVRFRPKSEIGFSNGSVLNDDSEAVSLDASGD